MTESNMCSQNRDPLKLVHEGTSQDLRMPEALPPDFVPVNEHGPEYGMVFAKAYSAFLSYYAADNIADGDWRDFFSKDVSVRLAVAAIDDVDGYRQFVKEAFDFLNDRDHQNQTDALKNRLGALFGCLGSLALQLDRMKAGLPTDSPLQGMLKNRIQTQLAGVFQRFLSYRKAALNLALSNDVQPELTLLGEQALSADGVFDTRFSEDWIIGEFADWFDYLNALSADASVFGDPAGSVFERINHAATHNLFTGVFDEFLKVYARTVADAGQAVVETLTDRDDHEPHYALFLAFLRLFEHVRGELNTLTGKHLDFYYRDILRLGEKPIVPPNVHLLVELAKQVDSHLLAQGTPFKAGKDDSGREAFFAAGSSLVANQAKVAALKTVYRHADEKLAATVPDNLHRDRLFASPEAASADGQGAKLSADDPSWHPFFNKRYQNGLLERIEMPEAEIGFAIASHYLGLAEGKRTVTMAFMPTGSFEGAAADLKDAIDCLFSGEKGWFEKSAVQFSKTAATLTLKIELDGADPAVVPYSAKVHGYAFATGLPMLLVKLRHRDDALYVYPQLQGLIVGSISLTVAVEGLRTLAVSNDFGSVDMSKPFQPFGALPTINSSLVIGSNEIFQKSPDSLVINVEWKEAPAPYNNETVAVTAQRLHEGQWQDLVGAGPFTVKDEVYELIDNPPATEETGGSPFAPDFSESKPYRIADRSGFVRLKLGGDFGQSAYEKALIDYIVSVSDSDTNNDKPQPTAPVGPVISRLTADYSAVQQIELDRADQEAFEQSRALFFHLAPFGIARQHPFLNADNKVFLLTQFGFERDHFFEHSEAEFYLGLTDLRPPQTLALLFQVADGTADPLTVKPDPHIQWSYLRANEWRAFATDEVTDATGGLINSGIIEFSVPDDATDDNTLLPPGMHWLRAAVKEDAEAVCRLQKVAAQALPAAFADRNNDPGFAAKTLAAGTITKTERADAAIKNIEQPFPSFGGRGAETAPDFYRRVSERLRHKDRAVMLWDYERLVLEAFPQLYRVKCLNHTQYEPGVGGAGSYRELAPGHVTVVTIPDLQFPTLRDPLKPYTSLGLLKDIENFLNKHISCFVKLHVRNPRFEAVRCAFKVRLFDGYDSAYYLGILRQAITRFLSPWAFVNDAKPSFGGKVYKSVLIDFVESQPYVDYVTDFRLFHDVEGANTGSVELNVVEATTAVSILVSAPSEAHGIEAFKPADSGQSGETCPCEL